MIVHLYYLKGFIMKILITGATSGIGAAFARRFVRMGHEVTAVGRSAEKLRRLRGELGCTCVSCELSSEENILALHENYRDIDILINNAGFGAAGHFSDIPLGEDINMLDVNVRAPLMLMKLYLRDMKARGSGYILNVASIAAFMPGPKMSTYYASKAYILRLTQAVAYELHAQRSGVYAGVLCPGPVSTAFNQTAGVRFKLLSSADPDDIAKAAIYNMFKRRTVILPTLEAKLIHTAARLTPDAVLEAISAFVNHIEK